VGDVGDGQCAGVAHRCGGEADGGLDLLRLDGEAKIRSSYVSRLPVLMARWRSLGALPQGLPSEFQLSQYSQHQNSCARQAPQMIDPWTVSVMSWSGVGPHSYADVPSTGSAVAGGTDPVGSLQSSTGGMATPPEGTCSVGRRLFVCVIG
jgi:hypothetical protein